jgi:hypothetical protein
VLLLTGIAWSVAQIGIALLPSGWYRLMPLAALVSGGFVPPVMQTLRAAWPRVVKGPALRTAYAVDATAQELLFMVGPMLGQRPSVSRAHDWVSCSRRRCQHSSSGGTRSDNPSRSPAIITARPA